MDKECDKEYALTAMKWYGWGSPVGLSFFLISIAICIAILRCVFK